jgi:prefoldin subunit 5
MDDKVQPRLELLRQEFEAGQQQLATIESQRAQLTETLLRISGAIQVLEELAGERPLEEAPAANGKQTKAKEKSPAG